MSDLSDLLLPDAVLSRVAASAKKPLFQQIGATAANVYGLDAAVVSEALAAREKLGSTGFGGGVATPHGKIAGLPRVMGVFATLAQPIEFDAVDDLPVDLVFALLSPVEAGSAHLKALAQVSRALRDRNFLAKLRGTGSPDALFALFSADENRDAA
ncbi:PTS sugar transporter subunit IIA [Sphingomonas immobilis]|uniref:PTS sugar transporter subunit IIA n=1 Tax=Sphingomonas immobilis TaxID=3063997 RepID=A0ABT8ZW82_9SPHN|nr:PTS sugar transporter subunit IIA [Sphingomonas sp. CA1-15]MDO7841399.1 PTS sugar transporter subunit IIA [Sphingomonas sp. CA1-15]